MTVQKKAKWKKTWKSMTKMTCRWMMKVKDKTRNEIEVKSYFGSIFFVQNNKVKIF